MVPSATRARPPAVIFTRRLAGPEYASQRFSRVQRRRKMVALHDTAVIAYGATHGRRVTEAADGQQDGGH